MAEQIKSRKVGNKLFATIEGKVYQKVCTDEEVESIKNKILLYNKKPTKTLLNTIIKMIDKTIEKKEVATAKEKGVKKAIKKVTKSKAKAKSTKKAEPKDLITEVETEFKAGNFNKEEIERLEDLLRKKKEAIKEEPKAVVKQQDSNDGGYRERYR